MNLAAMSVEPVPRNSSGGDIHLNEEGLELATGLVDVVNEGPAH
jgi:hypothetical protein